MRARVLPDTATGVSHTPSKHPKHGVRQGPVGGSRDTKNVRRPQKVSATRPLGRGILETPCRLHQYKHNLTHIQHCSKDTPVCSSLSVRKERSSSGLLKPELQLES